MKIRQGFVSNSSSSSFIVLFQHEPKNKEDLQEMMFPQYKSDETIGRFDCKLTISEIVEKVFNHIKNKVKNKLKDHSLEHALHGWNIEVENNYMVKIHETNAKEAWNEVLKTIRVLDKKYGPDWRDKEKEILKAKEYKAFLKANKKQELADNKHYDVVQKEAKKYYEDFKQKYKYHKFEKIFEFGDEFEGELILEHGDIFRYLPHLRFRHH